MESFGELLFDLFKSLLESVFSKRKTKRFRKNKLTQKIRIFLITVLALVLTVVTVILLCVIYYLICYFVFGE